MPEDVELETVFAKTTDHLEPLTEALVTRIAQCDLHRGISEVPVASARLGLVATRRRGE